MLPAKWLGQGAQQSVTTCLPHYVGRRGVGWKRPPTGAVATVTCRISPPYIHTYIHTYLHTYIHTFFSTRTRQGRRGTGETRSTTTYAGIAPSATPSREIFPITTATQRYSPGQQYFSSKPALHHSTHPNNNQTVCISALRHLAVQHNISCCTWLKVLTHLPQSSPMLADTLN